MSDRNTELVLDYASNLLTSLTEHFISTNPADEDDYGQSQSRLETLSVPTEVHQLLGSSPPVAIFSKQLKVSGKGLDII